MPGRPSSPPAAAAPAARRRPRQQRAQHTVGAIFQAVLNIVAREGEDQLNTNRIAEVAGVSIGTLYQYFPTKEAVVLALIEQRRAEALKRIEATLAEGLARQRSVADLVRGFVRSYLQAFCGADAGERALARLAWRLDREEAMMNAVRESSEKMGVHLQRLCGDSMQTPHPARMFVLTRAFMGTVRAAALERSPLREGRELEDELVRLCLAILEVDRGAGAR
jgi:AcrR family transcriptional regulator